MMKRLLNRLSANGIKTDSTTTTLETDNRIYTVSNDYLNWLGHRLNRLAMVCWSIGLFFGSGTIGSIVTTIVEAVRKIGNLTIGFGILSAICFVAVVIVTLSYLWRQSAIQQEGSKTLTTYRSADLDALTSAESVMNAVSSEKTVKFSSNLKNSRIFLKKRTDQK